MHRTVTLTLHWLVFLLLLALMSEVEHPAWFWSFAFAGLAMCGVWLVFGLMHKPGPALTGIARAAHPWMHRGLYVLLAMQSLWCAQVAWTGADPTMVRRGAFVLFSFASLHAIFHLWRHTALRDGALRLITPKAVHHIL